MIKAYVAACYNVYDFKILSGVDIRSIGAY